MMTQTSTTDENEKKARSLLQQGHIAYNNWEIKKARLLWRKAAVVDPANEQIWQALLNVMQDEEDRKVCLQNILVLNPDNEEAEQHLRLLENETQPADVPEIDPQPEYAHDGVSEGLKRMVSWLLTALLLTIVGVLLASMLIQPFV